MSWKSKLKGVARRAVRPAVAEQAARIDHHERAIHDITVALQQVQARVPEDLGARVDQHRAVIDQVETTFPSLLNTIASAHGQQRATSRLITQLSLDLGYRSAEVADLKRQVAELWERLETMRAELLFEMRYSAGSSGSPDPTAGASATVTANIVDAGAVEAQREAGAIRLNLGCGHQPLRGYVNVDMRELPGVEVVAAVDDLPFGEGEVAEIFSSHVLEHFPTVQLERTLLPYWRRLLRPGGELRAIVPDAAAMLAGHAAGEISFEDLREVTFGGQEYDGDFHFAFYTTDTMTELLERVGFESIEVEAAGRRNGKSLEFQIVGRVPADAPADALADAPAGAPAESPTESPAG